MALFEFKIITAEREVYTDMVEAILAPGVEGDLGILPGHAALMTMLRPGELMIRKDGEDEYLVITGGFVEVLNNQVTLLADACERSTEIDETRAEDAVKRARERLLNKDKDIDLSKAIEALRRAEVRVRVSKRKRLGKSQNRNLTPTG